MAAMSCQSRHIRLMLKATTNINHSLPVMPPFRQRLFSRQHASEYPHAIKIWHLPFNPALQRRYAALRLHKKLAIRLLSLRHVFVEFLVQFYMNKCAHSSALWHKMAAHTLRTWSQMNGAPGREKYLNSIWKYTDLFWLTSKIWLRSRPFYRIADECAAAY